MQCLQCFYYDMKLSTMKSIILTPYDKLKLVNDCDLIIIGMNFVFVDFIGM